MLRNDLAYFALLLLFGVVDPRSVVFFFGSPSLYPPFNTRMWARHRCGRSTPPPLLPPLHSLIVVLKAAFCSELLLLVAAVAVVPRGVQQLGVLHHDLTPLVRVCGRCE